MATVTVTEVTRFGETIIPRLKSIAAVGAEAVKSPNRVNAFEARYEFALELFTQFQNMYNRVSVASDKTEALEKLDKIVTTVDELLFEIKENCITIKKLSAASPPVTQSPITTSNVRLPKINVPVFSGDIKLFSSFFEIFSDLIHKNSSLSEIEKFHYLHTSLKGEASTLIQGLSLTAANYSIALDTLRNRYMNKRLIAHNHLNILKSLKPVIPGKHLSRSLRSVTELFLEQYKAFNALQLSAAEQLDFLWFDSLLNKLDSKTRERFELTLQNNQQIPTFKQLTEFLDTQCRALEITFLESSSGSNIPEDKKSEERLSGRKPSSYTLLANVNPNQPLCPFCKGAHFLSYCKSFLEKSPNERFQIAKQAKLCLNCLRCNHTLKNCSSSNTCKTCKLKHHTLLHFHKSVQSHDSLQSNIPIPNTSSKVEPTPMLVNALTNTLATRATVLLSTALVDAVDAKGNIQTLRVLLDSGSQANFITEQCIKKLGLSCIPSLLPIQGLSQMSSITPKGKTECYIQPTGKTLPQMSVEAIVLREICGAMPSVKLAEDTWEHIANLKLADPDFGTPRSIDMLLGAEVFPQVLLEGRLKGLNNSSPVAINTIFGWILMGKINVRHCETLHSFHVTSSLDTLEKTISHFWEVENVPQKGISSLEDDLAEDIFVNSYTRTDQGRFSVALPFRVDNRSFPSSRAIAINRFRSLERRLIRNPTLRNSYVDFMSDYLQSNHMEKLDSFLDDFDSYFIPHHCVIKPDSTTTKLRVVFDASAKLDGGISLNDTLYVGPKLQKDIFSILSRFRLHKIAITSDIKQMYRQILVHPEHRKYQLIVWRFSPEDDLETYQLNTVTYGLSSAPYLAQRTIIELAKLEKDKFPIAAQIASTDIYVDDIVTGCDSLAEAEVVKCQLISLFKSGGFELRKWSSNFPDFLSDVQSTPSSSLCLDSSENMAIQILGLHWKPDIDCFIFRVKPSVRDCTKRSILSEVSRIFDPLGFLAPLTFFVKHLIQILWTLKLEWDETPPSDILFRWSQFKSELHHLESLRMNRCLSIKNASSCQLHGFCDASEAGYAAVTYFRIVRNNKIYVSFVSGKSKVAPLKRISIPRLELCAAVLLAELIDSLKEIYQSQVNIDQTFAWSDSQIALCWINSSPHRWGTFVSNRVTHIQEKTPCVTWSHVVSHDNPADCASRGLLPNELINHELWWTGPKWLHKPSQFWPISRPLTTSLEVQKEEKRITLVVKTSPHFLDTLMLRFSSLRKIQGTLSYCLRFIPTSKRKFVRHSALSVEELYRATCILVKHVQSHYFAEDISKLLKGETCSKPFRKLAPFLDDQGVVRVGGRLRNADISYDQKHPMLLPSRSRLTELIIDQIHKDNLHPGPQTVQYLIQQTFWILSCRRAIKGRLSRCYRCFRLKPRSINPIMADLPAPRVSQLKPFLHTGVDFAGPFNVSISRHRGCKTSKAYICVFVCFSTKALHLELVSSLSADAFLAAFRRFIARRGRCTNLYSDCGTNFVGANKQLQTLSEGASGVLGIRWKFNPPSSPHFGGLWEAGVKSVKSHLIRVVGEQILTFEEFTTILTQIEAVLNSRPLSAMSGDPNDLQALTPGHFLTLEPLTAPPDDNLLNLKINRLSRWQLLQRCHQDFWKRWHAEYLHSLQERSKWNKITPSLHEGDLVIIKHDSIPPLQWHLGRVITLKPGLDGTPRVATVLTRGGVLQRPVVKLCPLPDVMQQ